MTILNCMKCLTALLFLATVGCPAKKGAEPPPPPANHALAAQDTRAIIKERDDIWLSFQNSGLASPYSPDATKGAFAWIPSLSTHSCKLYALNVQCAGEDGSEKPLPVRKIFDVCLPKETPLQEADDAYENAVLKAHLAVTQAIPHRECTLEKNPVLAITNPQIFLEEATGSSPYLYLDFQIAPSSLGVIQNDIYCKKHNWLNSLKNPNNGARIWLLGTRSEIGGDGFVSNNSHSQTYTCQFMEHSFGLMDPATNVFYGPLKSLAQELECGF